MFGFLGGSSTLVAGGHDSERERSAPPYPTPVSFPDVDSLSQRRRPSTWAHGSHPDLFERYANIRKLPDITSDHLDALNISFRPSEDIENLFEDGKSASSFIPPKSWFEQGAQEKPDLAEKSRVLYSGRPYPTQQEFYIRSKELQYDNDDGFRALTRTPRNGQPPPRLAHFRRFWEGLDNMAYYWDTTLDEYIPPKPEEAVAASTQGEQEKPDASIPNDLKPASRDDDEPRKRTKPNPVEQIVPSHPHLPVHNHISSSMLVQPRTQPPELPQRHQGNRGHGNSKSDMNPRVPPGTYRGNRIGNGAGMPEQHRSDTVRAFIEPIAWSFGFTISPHRRAPVLEIETLLVPIKLSGGVWRPPKQREKAKMGWLEGPVLGMSCRGETDFAGGNADPVLDTLREVGALLLIAQERAREGRKEIKPGEGKWWTTVPRWGGGPGGEVGEALATVASAEPVTEKATDVTDTKSLLESRGRPRSRGGSSHRRVTAGEAWKVLRPSVGFWDPRVEYSAIGREKDSVNDEVFLISSLNHHISVLKLTINDLYLDYLKTGIVPSTVPSDGAWCSPMVQRTRWYDLFNAEDRLEGLRAVWGVMGYLARTSESSN